MDTEVKEVKEPTVVQALDRQDEKTIREWFDELSGTATIKIKIYREEPRTFRNKKTNGLLDEVTELPDETYIRERWRGGKYRLQAMRLNAQQKWVFAGQRTVDIAGDPALSPEMYEDVIDMSRVGVSENGEGSVTLQKHAMDLVTKVAEQERDERRRIEDRAESRGGFDTSLLELIAAPLKMQVQALQDSLAAMQAANAAKEEKITELLTKKPEPTTTDRLLDKMVDGESARIEAIRTRHESEIRQLQEARREDEKRLRDLHQADLGRVEAAHEREIHTMRDAYKGQIASLETVNAGRIEGLQNRIRDLERDLDATKKELAELRAKKEQPLEDQLTRILTLKDTITQLTGNETEDQPVWAQVLDRFSPLIEGVGGRLAGGQPQPQMAAPPEVEPSTQVQRRKPSISPQEVGAALQFIENAARNQTDPTTFAGSARHMIPGQILTAIQEHGIDKFLDTVQLPEGSVLATQQGRNWARRVHKALMETP